MFKALLSISFLGGEKKHISKVSDLPGAVLVTFLQLTFTVNPFPLDITQGDTMRHMDVASVGGSREGMHHQHSAVPKIREVLG